MAPPPRPLRYSSPSGPRNDLMRRCTITPDCTRCPAREESDHPDRAPWRAHVGRFACALQTTLPRSLVLLEIFGQRQSIFARFDELGTLALSPRTSSWSGHDVVADARAPCVGVGTDAAVGRAGNPGVRSPNFDGRAL